MSQVSLFTVRSAAFPHSLLRRRTVGEAFKGWCSKNTNKGGIKAICSDRKTHNVSTKFLLSVHHHRLKRIKTFLDSFVTSVGINAQRSSINGPDS